MYIPPQPILAKYADVLVKFALNGGEGVRPGEVVQAVIPDVAKPLYKEIQRAILESRAHPKLHFIATETDSMFFELADDEQLTFFPETFKRAEADLIDHQISIIADVNPSELKDINPERLFKAMDARKKYRDWLNDKESAGKFTWTLALYGTEGMAKEAGMTLEAYWDQIIHGCYLDAEDPITEWRRMQIEQARVKANLDALQIEKVHVEAERIDLFVQLGKNRRWLGGSCRNIPSYELFISPDWRGCEGKIAFNQPLFRYGNILRDISLEFKNGKLTYANAKVGDNVLQSMIKRENADKIGEFSLTDKRFSRITKFMANTLFDENVGGEFGNTHIALGRAYRDSYIGNPATPTNEDWESWGFNNSPEHTDIISTEDRTVTAYLQDGSKKVIFKDGMFTV
ncbi:MAG: aminopeptidase [Candidatus Peribacteraceae bacterium]|nr:aminopeptidase [Candidatus Peribacteraceae bacterium]